MSYRLLADAVVVLHIGFVLFVVLGGLLVTRWRRLAWLHIPAAAWGVIVEYAGWICPLTPIENAFRDRAGEAAYAGDFITRYALPLLYPDNLTRTLQIVLGTSALALNVLVYARILRGRTS